MGKYKNKVANNSPDSRKIPVHRAKKSGRNKNKAKTDKITVSSMPPKMKSNANQKLVEFNQKSVKRLDHQRLKNQTETAGSSNSQSRKLDSIEMTQLADNSLKKKRERKQDKSSLRDRMMNKLQGARFRFINEQMYTSDGNKANQLFRKDPRAFQAYHEGFQQQVTQWEINPLDSIIANLKKKNHSLVVADFGCGDARLASSLPNKVHSFDLVALNERVTACDMAHTPLADESVDVAVFCLSLMGTNLTDYLLEANRVLKVGGQLKIAEVESRFEDAVLFIANLRKYGFKITSKNVSNSYFYFMDFKKEESVKKSNKLPILNLKPCVYKKR